MSNTLYLTDLKEITLVTVELANGTSVTAVEEGIAELDIRRTRLVLCRAYYIPEIKLNLLSCTRKNDHGVTTTFGLVKCRIVDRDDTILV